MKKSTLIVAGVIVGLWVWKSRQPGAGGAQSTSTGGMSAGGAARASSAPWWTYAGSWK